MMPKAERDLKYSESQRCQMVCVGCRSAIGRLYSHADEMDAFLREFADMLALGEVAAAVKTKIRGMLSELEK